MTSLYGATNISNIYLFHVLNEDKRPRAHIVTYISTVFIFSFGES